MIETKSQDATTNILLSMEDRILRLENNLKLSNARIEVLENIIEEYHKKNTQFLLDLATNFNQLVEDVDKMPDDSSYSTYAIPCDFKDIP